MGQIRYISHEHHHHVRTHYPICWRPSRLQDECAEEIGQQSRFERLHDRHRQAQTSVRSEEEGERGGWRSGESQGEGVGGKEQSSASQGFGPKEDARGTSQGKTGGGSSKFKNSFTKAPSVKDPFAEKKWGGFSF